MPRSTNPFGWSSGLVAAALCAVTVTAAADTGFLDVSSDPPQAKILIDDTDVGQATPQHHLPVAAGHHRLTLVTRDGAHRRTIGFTVDAGQTKTITLVFSQSP